MQAGLSKNTNVIQQLVQCGLVDKHRTSTEHIQASPGSAPETAGQPWASHCPAMWLFPNLQNGVNDPALLLQSALGSISGKCCVRARRFRVIIKLHRPL